MSRYTKPQPKDEERDLRLAIMRLELRELLWRQVTIPDAQVHLALGLGGDSSWQALKAAGDAPPRVQINQRIFVLTADLRAWLENREKKTTTKGQRNNGEQEHPDDDASPTQPPTARPASLASGLLAATHPSR